jgi:hypothetical protein
MPTPWVTDPNNKPTLILKMRNAFKRVKEDTRTVKDIRELDSIIMRLRFNYGMKYKDLARVAGVDLPEWEEVMQNMDTIPI